mmetsp:Transcript_47739/g.34998  ORF Transcript_47739/g.34998 Transcript_47739/m.34998 type:complete len:164 (+) Transcript_47739:2174-2665(+)|eukprot:CAMPEP_0202967168 /NCGR_PEP_ID=MMETSP1396-20130829/11949_1 /ASSEMBLY_ACC=CAM_ASM_000872 /TAXON_ID= /ORGANISM="Pseudokeronopsis sp., Strain Brazil" /LENGTH=163 /DNA_ID=CAMNT_0049691923 /DNA_START=831 /DNA_END=1322 /DNA_ORIENTATION=+
MVTQAYELNHLIPNCEMIIYKMFCSPLCTKELRDKKDRKEVLLGNIFAEKGVQLGPIVFRSLLETLYLYPKKKHFKKIVQYLLKVEEVHPPEIVSLVIQVGIAHQYPTYLGRTVKQMIETGVEIPVPAFRQFLYFIERCKGYEEDAKRFLSLIKDTNNISFDF